jgi:hypothetical protein
VPLRNGHQTQTSVSAAVLDAVRSGGLTERRIDASVWRVLVHKLRRHLFTHARYVGTGHAERVVGAAHHRRTPQKITDRTITLVGNHRRRLLPLAPSRGACWSPAGAPTTYVR